MVAIVPTVQEEMGLPESEFIKVNTIVRGGVARLRLFYKQRAILDLMAPETEFVENKKYKENVAAIINAYNNLLGSGPGQGQDTELLDALEKISK